MQQQKQKEFKNLEAAMFDNLITGELSFYGDFCLGQNGLIGATKQQMLF